MPSWNRSLRTRLTGGVLLIFAVVFGFAGLLTDRFRARDFEDALDERLEFACLTLLESARVRGDAVSFSDLSFGTLSRLGGVCWQLVRPPDEVVLRSPNLGASTLPTKAGPAGEVRTITLDLGDRAGRTEFRLLTRSAEAGDGPPLRVQAAVRTAPVRRSLLQLRRLLLAVGLFGLLCAGVLCWLLTGRMIAPLAQLAARSAGFSPRDGWVPLGSRSRDEIGDLVRAIDAMGARAAATVQAQERFVADASHELKTPLAVVLAEAQVLRQQPRSSEEYQAFLQTVQEELAQLVYLVESLLTLARAQAGVPFSFRPVAVNEVLMEALEQCAPRARAGDVRLVPTLVPPTADDRDAVVAGDPQLLRVMLHNLLRNAVRYSPPGASVDVSARRAADQIELRVRDHGPGINPDALRQVFEPFFRMPDAEKWGEGVGLGLTLVREITYLHGGTVRAENHTDGGALFTVALPASSNEGASD